MFAMVQLPDNHAGFYYRIIFMDFSAKYPHAPWILVKKRLYIIKDVSYRSSEKIKH